MKKRRGEKPIWGGGEEGGQKESGGSCGEEGKVPIPFLWHMWHPRVGQQDAVMLLLGKGQ